jgi:hypothetical protein
MDSRARDSSRFDDVGLIVVDSRYREEDQRLRRFFA